MALPTNTFTTFDLAAGDNIREDLTNQIFNISPTKTPFSSKLKRTKSKQSLHEWQTDELAAVNTSNALIQGDDASFIALTPSTRLGNYHQILGKAIVTSGTANAVDVAGRKREHAYQIAKKGMELRRDLEAILLGNQAANGASEGVAATMGTMGAFVKTNTSLGATGTDPVYTNIPTDPRNDGTQRPFTEALLIQVLEEIWTEGGEPTEIMVGAHNKGVVSNFAGIASATNEVSTGTRKVIGGGFHVYVSEWGDLKVVPNRFQRARDAWVIDYSTLELPMLRPLFREKLAKTGDNEKEHMLMEVTFKVGQEKSLGGVFDLDTA